MGFGKLALTALAVGLLPYEVKKGEDGGISYKSLLVNVKAKKGDEGEHKVELSFFNVPDFIKNTAPETEDAPETEAAVEDADFAEEPAGEEPPVEEVPAEESPVEEPAGEQNAE